MKVPGLAGCDGAAVSKRDGALVCIHRDDKGQLTLDPKRRVVVARGEILSGCDVGIGGSVWVASNLLGANVVTEVGQSEKHRYQTWAPGSIEAITIVGENSDGGVDIVLVSDTNSAPSAAFRYRCGTAL